MYAWILNVCLFVWLDVPAIQICLSVISICMLVVECSGALLSSCVWVGIRSGCASISPPAFNLHLSLSQSHSHYSLVILVFMCLFSISLSVFVSLYLCLLFTLSVSAFHFLLFVFLHSGCLSSGCIYIVFVFTGIL